MVHFQRARILLVQTFLVHEFFFLFVFPARFLFLLLPPPPPPHHFSNGPPLTTIQRDLSRQCQSWEQNTSKIYTHVKTHKLLQICKQVVSKQGYKSISRDVLPLLVPSCCDKSGTSCQYHILKKLIDNS